LTSAAFRTKGRRSLGRKDGVAVGAVVGVIVGVVVAATVGERAGVTAGGSGVEIDPETPADCTDVGVAYGV